MLLKYRGRVVTEADAAFIRNLIADHPSASRRRLSELLCEVWDWRQPNGTLRAMVCRGLMLALHRAGHIQLPPPRSSPVNPLVQRRKPAPPEDVDQTPIEGTLSCLRPLEIRLVRGAPLEPFFNSLIERHHYLGYTHPVGERLKYMVYSNERPVACFAWSSAPRHLGCRDRFIGWPPQTRRNNIHLVAYNPRYLILPWVRVRYLASHLLSRMARRLSDDWQSVYGHPICFLETFVDPALYRGTCYRAAGWQCLGVTTGRGKDDQTKKPNRSVKEVWGFPLGKRFRERLIREDHR